MPQDSIFGSTAETYGLAIRTRYPGQPLQIVESIPNHLFENLVLSDRMPPFVELMISDNDGGYRACTEDEVTTYARALRLLDPNLARRD